MPRFLLLVLLGCTEKIEDSADDSGGGEADADTDADADDTGFEEPDGVTVDWGESAMTLTVDGGPGYYMMGMAETANCTDCWTGEDCFFGHDGGTPICHYFEDGAYSISLTYGADKSSVEAGVDTAFGQADGPNVTFILLSITDPGYKGNGGCWAFGNDHSYYSDYGCIGVDDWGR